MLAYATESLRDDLTNTVVYIDDSGELTHRELCKAPEPSSDDVPATESGDAFR